MHHTAKQFAGVYTAIITPFNQNDELDLEAFSKLIDLQLKAGIDGLVICGSTGEGITLTDDERFTLVKHAVKQVAGKIPVVAGAGHASTKIACDLQKQMKALGATATLHVTPWYNKPTTEGLYLHFSQVAESSDLPIILYNVPGRTACDLPVDVILRLSQNYPNIIGLKDSNIDPVRIQQILAKARPDFCFFSGEDGFVLPLLAMGGQGVISVCSNIVPKTMLDMIRAYHDDNMTEAQTIAARIAELTPVMFMKSNPIPVKSSAHLMGLIENTFRLPLCPLSKNDMDTLRQKLSAQGWL